MKKLICFAILIAIELVLCSCGSKAKMIEGDGYKTPEEAITAYAEALKEMNLDAMIGCFAVESYARNFNSRAYLEDQGYYQTYMYMSLSGKQSSLADQINIEHVREQILSKIDCQTRTIALHNSADLFAAYLSGSSITTDDDSNALISAYSDFSGLGRIEIGDTRDPSSLSDNYENMSDRMTKLAEIDGADEMCSVAIELKVEGENWLLSMDADRYGDRWYLRPTGNSVLANLLSLNDRLGGLMPLENGF